MSVENLTTEGLDYLQRSGFEPRLFHDSSASTNAPVNLRRLLKIEGIGHLDKDLPRTSKRLASLSADLLAGMYNYKIPLAFLVDGELGQATVSIGTWSPVGSDANTLELNEKIIESALRGLFPAVSMKARSPLMHMWPFGGLALGMPTLKMPDDLDGALPIDRLLRALRGERWAALILAQPVAESVVRDLRLRPNRSNLVTTSTSSQSSRSIKLLKPLRSIAGTEPETVSETTRLGSIVKPAASISRS